MIGYCCPIIFLHALPILFCLFKYRFCTVHTSYYMPVYRRGNQNVQSRETGNIGNTRRRKTNQKHNTICVEHHLTQANTNKTWALPQTAFQISVWNLHINYTYEPILFCLFKYRFCTVHTSYYMPVYYTIIRENEDFH
jgi:hypothetical protein